jgi:WD40 repeat protein
VADVFISYAHEDDRMVERLIAALGDRNREVWIDARDIQPADRWLQSANEGIERSDAFLFIVSTHSLRSEPCLGEFEYAMSLNKRLIPVCLDEAAVDMDKPETLADLDWTMMRPDDDFDQAVDRVARGLDTDLDVARAHTRILVRARAWEQADRRTSPLLRGEELRAAEAWLLRAASGVSPQPTELQREFIAASRRTATRRLRTVAGVSAGVTVVAIVLTIFAFVQRHHAVAEAHAALSGDLAAESSNTIGSNVAIGSLLSLEAYAQSPTIQARSAMDAAAAEPLERVIPAAIGEVNSIDYDPGGHVMAVGGRHGVFVWDTKSSSMVGKIFDTTQQVNSVAFSPSGSLLAVGQSNGDVSLFTVSDRSLETHLSPHSGGVSAVAFAPNGTTLAAATEQGELVEWDPSTGASSKFLVGAKTGLLSATFSPDGSTIAVSGGVALSNGGTTGFVNQYSVSGSGQLTGTFTDDGTAVSHTVFNASGSILAASDDDGHVFLLNPATSQSVGTINDGTSVAVPAIAFNPAGTRIATGDSEGIVRMWNPTTLQEVGAPMGHGSIVYGLEFSPNGQTLASGGLDGTVLVWNSADRPPGATTITGKSSIQDLSTSEVGGFVATANGDGSTSIWSLRTGRRIDHLSDGTNAITSVNFAPHSAILAIGANDGDVFLYNVAAHKTVGELRRPGNVVNLTAFNAQGTVVAVGYGNGAVTLWNVESRRRIRTLPLAQNSTEGVNALSFNPRGTDLAVSEALSGVTLFDQVSAGSKGIPVPTSESIFSLAYSPDGSLLAAGDLDGDVELLSTGSHKLVTSLPGNGSTIYGVAMSRVGGILATVDAGGSVHLWDLAHRFELGAPLDTGSTIFTVAFSPGGSTLVTGDSSGAVVQWPSILWSARLSDVTSDLCPRLRRNLTAAQWAQYAPGQTYQTVCTGYPNG